jgi:hypothetical protein
MPIRARLNVLNKIIFIMSITLLKNMYIRFLNMLRANYYLVTQQTVEIH